MLLPFKVAGGDTIDENTFGGQRVICPASEAAPLVASKIQFV